MTQDARRSSPVLIVEDHEETRTALALLLDLKGYAVVTAGDGAAALDYLRDGPAALIVTDLEMPRIDGWLLRMRLLEDPALAQIPVVVYSGRAAGDLPDVAYVPKSNPTGLLDAIDREFPR